MAQVGDARARARRGPCTLLRSDPDWPRVRSRGRRKRAVRAHFLRSRPALTAALLFAGAIAAGALLWLVHRALGERPRERVVGINESLETRVASDCVTHDVP